MSTSTAMKMTAQMVDFYASKQGRESAVMLVARKAKLTKWPIYRLLKGQIKEIGADAFDRIQAAYLEHCEAQIAHLQREIEMARGNDHLEDLGAEVQALAAKIKAKKEKLK